MLRHPSRCLVRTLGIIAAVAVCGSALAASDDRDTRLDEIRDYIQANDLDWTAGHTPISDLPLEEARKLLGLRVSDGYEAALREIQATRPTYPLANLPPRFDWLDSSGVSPVRNQLCGDCWAQCSVASIESKLRIFDGDTTRLSVQQAIDCNFGGSSCDGGWWEHTYDMYRLVGGMSEACYPYAGVDQTCAEDVCAPVCKIDAWEYIDTTVVSIKTHLMTNGPIAVGMAVWDDFFYYDSGCYEHAGPGTVNHGVLIVGWDDSMCDGAGAWHVKNSWGTYWGESGYAWLKYGTCQIGVEACIVHYTPRQRTLLSYAAHTVIDSLGDNDGKADPGETITLPVGIANTRWDTATGVSATVMTPDPGVTVLTASAAFPDVPQGETRQSTAPHFVIWVDPAVLCGTRIHFVLSATCDQGVFTDTFDMLVGDAQVVFVDDAEADLGWSLTSPGDDATAGGWIRKNPTGSAAESLLVQCEFDHTPGSLVRCFVTSNIMRYLGPDAADVDGGRATLTSPVIDLSAYASARLRYWRWYTNDVGLNVRDDVWKVDISRDSGGTWTNLESDSASAREWTVREFNLADHAALTDGVRLRFVASDYGEESTVEAAVDDIEITGCPYWVDATPPSAEILTPDGGEEILENTYYEIAWTADDDYGLRAATVVASYDGGATYPDTLGVLGGLDSVLTWHVPPGEHLNCRIGIEAIDRGYNTTFDESDSAFAIVREGSGIDVTGLDVPERVVLIGSELNPFSGSTHVFFGLPRRMDVRITVYDATGRSLRDLGSAQLPEGYHSVVWDGKASSGATVGPGVYFMRLEAGGVACAAKVLVAR